jgi:hypothetical protein
MTAESPGKSGSNDPDIIDLEEYAKAGKDVPKDHKYRIRIDRERYEVAKPRISGREILALAGKTPEEYLLHQRLRGGGTRAIQANEVVDLTGPGPERFMTMKRETQEGQTATRRQFRLAAADETYLTEAFPKWEAVADNGAQWLLVPQFPLPVGYNATNADLGVWLVAGYPDTALDMAYFVPALARVDGKAIPNLSTHPFDGRVWQRWSRHRTAANPWTVGEDNVSTHVAYINWFLAEEFRKRP